MALVNMAMGTYSPMLSVCLSPCRSHTSLLLSHAAVWVRDCSADPILPILESWGLCLWGDRRRPPSTLLGFSRWRILIPSHTLVSICQLVRNLERRESD